MSERSQLVLQPWVLNSIIPITIDRVRPSRSVILSTNNTSLFSGSN